MAERVAPVIAVIEQSNAYQSMIIQGVRSVLEERGTPLLLVSRDPHCTAAPPSLLRAIAATSPRGVITTTLTSADADSAVRHLLDGRADLSAVHLGSATDGSCVRADNAGGIRQLVEHLVQDCGVRRPVILRGHPHQIDSREREEAVRADLADLGVVVDNGLCLTGEFDRDRAHRELRALLGSRRDFDAVIAFNDRMALGALDALRIAGLAVPDDVVVCGFDDEDVAMLSRPPLTTVSQQVAEQGATAARLLLAAMDGEAPQVVRVPTRLVVRESTDRPGAAGTAGTAGAAEAARATRRTGETKDVAVVTERLWSEVTILDTSLAMTRALMRCRSVAEVLDALASALPRLGVIRCFAVLFDPAGDGDTAPGTPVLGRVALVHRENPGPDGAQPDGAGPDGAEARQLFDVASLLPADLVGELSTGTLMLQPLSTSRGEFGYLLLELDDADRFVGDAIRRDLSRTLDTLARNAELAEQAETLELLVGERTLALQAEVGSRRRAEDELRRLNEELRCRLQVDGLTGITNRVGFDEKLAMEWSAHSRSHAPLSLLMVDVDHFKRFNDTYGHLAGDECLRMIAACLAQSVQRTGDVVARFGGEEFAVILPNTAPAGAVVIARRLRALLARIAREHAGSPHSVVTVSVGAATAYPDPSPNAESLVADADVALYAAKAAGRDRVVAAEGGLLTG